MIPFHSVTSKRGIISREARRSTWRRLIAIGSGIAVAAGLLAACSAGKGSYSAPLPTPTFLSGTPGTVAVAPSSTIGPAASGPPATPAPPGSTPVVVIAAGTPIALNTAGASPVPPHPGTPTVVAAAASETPIPSSCGAPNAEGTPSASQSAGSSASANGNIIGPAAPGPYTPNGSFSPKDDLGVSISALESNKWEPNTILVHPGQRVTLAIKNGGHTTFDFCSPALLHTDVPIPVRRPDVAADVITTVVQFTAPSQTGAYQFWSNMDHQAEAGMVGEVIVQGAPATPGPSYTSPTPTPPSATIIATAAASGLP